MTKTSAAPDLVVPTARAPDRLGDLRGATPAEIESAEREARYERLRETIAKFGPKPNKHDLVDVLIGAAIMEGVTAQSNIIGMLSHLGFHRGHIARRLIDGTGSAANGYPWSRDANGLYSLNEKA